MQSKNKLTAALMALIMALFTLGAAATEYEIEVTEVPDISALQGPYALTPLINEYLSATITGPTAGARAQSHTWTISSTQEERHDWHPLSPAFWGPYVLTMTCELYNGGPLVIWSSSVAIDELNISSYDYPTLLNLKMFQVNFSPTFSITYEEDGAGGFPDPLEITATILVEAKEVIEE